METPKQARALLQSAGQRPRHWTQQKSPPYARRGRFIQGPLLSWGSCSGRVGELIDYRCLKADGSNHHCSCGVGSLKPKPYFCNPSDSPFQTITNQALDITDALTSGSAKQGLRFANGRHETPQVENTLCFTEVIWISAADDQVSRPSSPPERFVRNKGRMTNECNLWIAATAINVTMSTHEHIVQSERKYACKSIFMTPILSSFSVVQAQLCNSQCWTWGRHERN